MKNTLTSLLVLLALSACESDLVERPPAPPHEGIYSLANGCFTVDAALAGSTDSRWLAVSEMRDAFVFNATLPLEGAKLFLRASDLGTYLLYDDEGFFVTSVQDGDSRVLARSDDLESDLTRLSDTFVSPAEWELEVAENDEARFQLRHRATGELLAPNGSLVASAGDAATLSFYPATGCAEFPELTLDAASTGEVDGRVDGGLWEDGDVYGFVETHAHLFTNQGFGGAGMFHGAPYHRLGVEHALPGCEQFHGLGGRRDLIGYAFSDLRDINTDTLVNVFVNAQTPEDDHLTDGYPTFSDWPNAWGSSTHQTQYYRWIERAYLSGLRLLIQDATTNSVLCELLLGLGAQPTRRSCNDMVAVDKQIEETYALERYIDAQSGGPGRGWFRVVTTPAEAREVIEEGRMAVVLGIETSNLFDCFLTPPEGTPTCDADHVRAELDRYYERGVRAIFPVHKFDNSFSAGDGDRNVGQIGSFINSGHFSNLVTSCPESHAHFDRGNVRFGGINMPRPNYQDPAQNDMSGFAGDPLGTLVPFLAAFGEPELEGSYCQATGFTPLGETLMEEMMFRGMIIEVDHLPRRSYERAYELLVENDYPAAGTHGGNNDGLIYRLGGVSKTGFGRCGRAGETGAMAQRFINRMQVIEDNGGYVAEGFGFDLNGFAGGPRPRFGENSTCGDPQENPITYPFRSYRGDVEFTQPQLGEREVDFNTEGMLHIGLIPELIEDARRDGMSDEELEPLFRSAEGYLRMWERAEERGAALRP